MTAGDRREQILDITQEIVGTEGFHAATPHRIAEAAGITRPVLYQQFGDLATLLVALVDRESARAAAQFAQTLIQPGAVLDADPFVAAFQVALRVIDDHPETWRLFLFPPEGAPMELFQRLAQSRDRILGFLEHELSQAFPALQDPEYAARILHAAGRELLQLRLADPENATNDRLLSLVRGLRTGALFRGAESAATS
jgi:AcrR family transcriptional regulator